MASAFDQIRDPQRRHAALATVDPVEAAAQHADLQRRHERLKAATMDVIGALERLPNRSVNVMRAADRLRDALHAEARDG